MRVLLDEQLPRQLVPYFVDHEVRMVQQEGWAGLKNGVLLTKAKDSRVRDPRYRRQEHALSAEQTLALDLSVR